MPLPHAKVEAAFETHRARLERLAHAMLGVQEDAEDCVQATFTTALTTPPPDQERDLGPWLTRVASNRARDMLRARQRAAYTGVWLPEPVSPSPSPHERLALMQTLTYSGLAALEALTELQRCVLVLRDVCELSTRECADALEMSEANVKTTLHRARKIAHVSRISGEDTITHKRRQRALLSELITALATMDTTKLEHLLSDDAVMRNDANGEFVAALKPVRGRDKIIRFLLARQADMANLSTMEFVDLAHDTGLWIEGTPNNPRVAPRSLIILGLDAEDKITGIFTVMTPAKLGNTGLI